MSLSDDRTWILKLAGIAAVSSAAVGISIYLARRKENQLMETDRLVYLVEKLRDELDAIRHDVKDLRTMRLQKRNSVVRFRDDLDSPSVSGIAASDAPLVPSLKRATSYQSVLSDEDYEDAEDEWENGTVTIPCLSDPTRPPITIPRLSFDDIDRLFGTENVKSGYDSLKKRYSGCATDKSNPELLWRLAKLCHEMSGRTTDKGKKKDLIQEGQGYAVQAHQADEKNFQAVKWAAIMTGQLTDYLGTKEKIEQGSKFKEYLDKALKMDPKEFSLLHMRGRYSFSVANLSWLERKAAAIFYATPPTATIDEALTDFLAAYESKPEWIENLVYLGRCYIAQGDKVNAKKYLLIAKGIKAVDDSEETLLQESTKLLSKC